MVKGVVKGFGGKNVNKQQHGFAGLFHVLKEKQGAVLTGCMYVCIIYGYIRRRWS